MKTAAENNVVVRDLSGKIDEEAARLERAIQERGYGLLGTIDLAEKMRAKGLEFARACRVFEVCNPNRARDVLEHDMRLSTALPCRISLYEAEDGGVRVATLRPTTILSAFDQTDLQKEARAVEADLVAILDAVAPAS